MPTQDINRLNQIDTLMIPDDGWIPVQETWTYGISGSSGSPIYRIDVQANVTGSYPIGAKVYCNPSGSSVFMGFIMGLGSFSGGVTPMFVYGGTNFTLPSGTITNPKISPVKSPFGFPLNPDYWSISASGTVTYTKSSPVNGTWYGDTALTPTGPSITFVLGVWDVSYFVISEVSAGANAFLTVYVSLSTSPNSESSKDWTSAVFASTTTFAGGMNSRNNRLSILTPTVYYLITKTSVAVASSIVLDGSIATIFIRAVCAYL